MEVYAKEAMNTEAERWHCRRHGKMCLTISPIPKQRQFRRISKLEPPCQEV
jgi:hypothetical protein